jgi:hypothetical protein
MSSWNPQSFLVWNLNFILILFFRRCAKGARCYRWGWLTRGQGAPSRRSLKNFHSPSGRHARPQRTSMWS